MDVNRALDACINTSTCDYYDALGDYMHLGYIPADKTTSSVSKTIEFAYDDWCIAQIADRCGRKEIYNNYQHRSGYFNNVFDNTKGFMRPKLSDGRWKSPFDPLDTHGQGFIEGNAWTYSLFVPHEVDSLITLFGGKEKFTNYLDSLFTMSLDDKYIVKNEDITRDGIIGNYVHGNEPGHHIPYLYNYADVPWKTQERVRMIMNTMYGPGNDGLCGNDDAGQMSAWYIFSALGFYPVCPGSERYELGSPLVKDARIDMGDGKVLTVKTFNQGEENVYVEKVELNGKKLERNYILHSDIDDGGELIFYMNNTVK